jgi:flagellar motor switch protein FliN
VGAGRPGFTFRGIEFAMNPRDATPRQRSAGRPTHFSEDAFMAQDPNSDIILGVQSAVVDLFDTMLSMPIRPVAGEMPEAPGEQLLVGFISLAGKVMGSVDIQVGRAMAARMAAGMLGMAPEEIESEEEIKDVIRELCNIIAGNLKSKFCDAGLVCEISSPSITTGTNFKVQTLHMERYERFVFAHADEHFCVEVAVKFRSQDEADLRSILKLKKVDVRRFKRLDIISSVGDSIIELFGTMLSMDVELSDRPPFQHTEDLKLMGQISFTGHVKGNIQFQVSRTFGRMITAAMLGQELEKVQDLEQVKDVVGEMTNILAGNLKAAFCDTGLLCQIGTPAITLGADFHIEILNMDRYERFAFKLNDHDILVEICVKIENQAGAEESAPSPEEEASAPQTLDDAAIQALLAAAQNGAAPPASDATATPPPALDAAPASPGAAAPAAAMPPPAAAPAAVEGPAPENLGFILDIPVRITVELGRGKMAIKDLLKLGKGSPLVLANLEGEPLDILANNRLIAKGEVLVEHEKYGIRITEVVNPRERFKTLAG